MNFKQLDSVCVCGKSVWIIDGKCNKCGVKRDVPPSFYETPTLSKIGRPPKGKGWDKKKHKVVEPK